MKRIEEKRREEKREEEKRREERIITYKKIIHNMRTYTKITDKRTEEKKRR